MRLATSPLILVSGIPGSGRSKEGISWTEEARAMPGDSIAQTTFESLYEGAPLFCSKTVARSSWRAPFNAPISRSKLPRCWRCRPPG
jgi:hypothetical protein